MCQRISGLGFHANLLHPIGEMQFQKREGQGPASEGKHFHGGSRESTILASHTLAQFMNIQYSHAQNFRSFLINVAKYVTRVVFAKDGFSFGYGNREAMATVIVLEREMTSFVAGAEVIGFMRASENIAA